MHIINVKTAFIKTSKTAKIHYFVRFVMYCSIIKVSLAFYWACSDDTVHYKRLYFTYLYGEFSTEPNL